MQRRQFVVVGAAVLSSLSTAALSRGVVVADFEPAKGYVAGADLPGVDGWFTFNGTKGVVTPDPASGYTSFLQGSQSYVMWGSGAGYGKRFGSASSSLTAGANLSWLMRFETSTSGGLSGVYFSDNPSGGTTPAGIEANDTTDEFQLFGLGQTLRTGVKWQPNRTYKLEMALDFVNHRFEGFVTDIAGGGTRTSLGKRFFGLYMDAPTTAVNGGVIISKPGGTAAYVDSIALNSTATPVPDPVDAAFGKRWVRSHPLQVMGVPTGAAAWTASGGLAAYRNGGFTTAHTLAWDSYVTAEAIPAGMPWQAYLSAESPSGAAQQFDAIPNRSGLVACMAGDEPWNPSQIRTYSLTAAYVRSKSPETLVYTNALPITVFPQGSYTYSQYLDDINNIIKPDVMMYDLYPFNANGTDHNSFFSNLAIVRSKALAAGKPYWAWMQSWSQASAGVRYPSESDLRMQMFAHLTAGYTGFNYWTYTKYPTQDLGLFDAANQPTALYYAAASANVEARRLGQSLRLVMSTDLRFLPGRTNGSVNPTPSSLSAWSAGAGGDAHLQLAQAAGAGSYNNGLIGFFRDDAGQELFMLTNLNHGQGLTAAGAAVGLSLTFDSTINELLRLNRSTGEPEKVVLMNHVLEVTLPGGTGELLKYNDGFFPGIPGGDATLDGKVDVVDLGILATSWQSAGSWNDGDFNFDGVVDVIDLGILATNWQAGARRLAEAPAMVGLPPQGVPEPAGATGLIGLAMMALSQRRRNHG